VLLILEAATDLVMVVVLGLYVGMALGALIALELLKWAMARWRMVTGVVLVVGVLIGLALKSGAIWSSSAVIWTWYQGNKSPSEAIGPLLTLATGLIVAWIALMRHFATTDADRQRRIT